MLFGGLLECWHVSSVKAWFFLFTFLHQIPLTARRCPFSLWKHLWLSIYSRSSFYADEYILQKGTEHERKLRKPMSGYTSQSGNRNLIFFFWVILYPVCGALDQVIHPAQKSRASEASRWSPPGHSSVQRSKFNQWHQAIAANRLQLFHSSS